MLIAAIAVAFSYLLLASFVIATDPLNIYSWGARPHLDRRDIPRDLVVDWMAVAIDDREYNTYLVGSSVTAMYSPDELQEIFGPQSRVANLSYGGPRPKDRSLVLDRLLRRDGVDRVMLTFDWTYISDPELTNAGFPAYLYDDDLTNDLRMVNLPTIHRTLRVFSGDTVFRNDDDQIYDRYVEAQFAYFQSAKEMKRIAKVVKNARGKVGRSSGKTCKDFPAVTDQLIPTVMAFSEKGVKVDIIIPTASYAFYAVRETEISPTLLDQTLIARRCMVKGLSGQPNVRIFAFDEDPAIAGDLANFREVVHVYNPDLLKMVLRSLKTGEHQLTKQNVAEYEAAIRNAVMNYTVVNSRQSGGESSAPPVGRDTSNQGKELSPNGRPGRDLH